VHTISIIRLLQLEIRQPEYLGGLPEQTLCQFGIPIRDVVCYLTFFSPHSANFLTSRSSFYFILFPFSCRFHPPFRISYSFYYTRSCLVMSCCKCGGHFWSRVKTTVAETGIGFRNSEIRADGYVLYRVFRNVLHRSGKT
jgi:hypothetical protein